MKTPIGNTLLLGILCMLAATLFNVASDSLYKWVRITYQTHPSYLLIARYSGLFCVVIIWQLLKYKSLKPALKTQKLSLHLLRGCIIVGSTLSSIFALQYTPISVYTIIMQFTPLWVILVLQFLPEERLNLKQFGLVLLGLVGVIIALNPNAQDFQWGWLITLLVIFCWGSFQAITRYLSQTETTASLMLYNTPIGLSLGILGVSLWGSPLHMAEFYGLIATAIIGAIAFPLIILAYRWAAAKYVAPLAWFQVLWSLIADIFIFKYSPFQFSLLLGGALIIISAYGIFRLSNADKPKA